MRRPGPVCQSRLARSGHRLCLAGLLLLAGQVEIGLADDWAEPMPLVESSLLLDVDRDDRRVIAVGERGHVLVSNDRGASWRQGSVPTRSTLTAVRIAGGERVFAAAYDGMVLRSDDGGLSWSAQPVSPEPDRPLLDLWFANPRRGLAIGAYGLRLTTGDGGRTWRQAPGGADGFHANAIAAAPDGTLYIVGEAGSIMCSEDRGATWHHLATPYEGSLFGALALDDDAILVFGLRGHLFRSEDQGRAWRRIATGTNATLLTGLLRADGRIVIAGLSGVLLLSDDGGRRFRLRHRPDRQATAALVELGPNQLLAVGEGGLTSIPDHSLRAARDAPVDGR